MRPGRADEIDAALESLGDLSQFSGWVAHEVNNPIGGIRNAFALIRDAIPADHPHFRFVAAIDREIARIAALTQRVHQIYAYDGEQSMTMPLGRYVADAVRALDSLRQARRVTIEADIEAAVAAEPLAGAYGRGVVRHLIQHGVERAPPDSVVRVAAWRERDLVWLAVPVFAPLPGNARGAVAGPAGLALQLVQRIVRAAGGALINQPAGEAPGEIRIGLPRVAVAAEAE